MINPSPQVPLPILAEGDSDRRLSPGPSPDAVRLSPPCPDRAHVPVHLRRKSGAPAGEFCREKPGPRLFPPVAIFSAQRQTGESIAASRVLSSDADLTTKLGSRESP